MKAALIGHGIQASLTPALHQAEAEAQQIACDYQLFDTALPPFDGLPLAEMLQLAARRGFAGVNVTHPYKLEAAALMHQLTPSAELLGAVNTVLFDGQRSIGHNTDYVGFRSALRRALPLAPIRQVLQIGAGGAGAAVALALLDQGAEQLILVDQDGDRATALRRRLLRARPEADIRVEAAVQQIDLAPVNGVVNATPLGMASHPGLPMDPAELTTGSWVADIVYFPRTTAFLQRATEHGLRTLDGAPMAIFQAVAAFQLFTGLQPDPIRMAQSFNRVSTATAEAYS